MATRRQGDAATRNIEQTQKAASRQRTIAHLPVTVRHALGRQGREGRRRGREPGWALEDGNRPQLDGSAKERNIGGGSGRRGLIEAIRGSR
jgi:hypothetical protein